jgi:hypothetical protein
LCIVVFSFLLSKKRYPKHGLTARPLNRLIGSAAAAPSPAGAASSPVTLGILTGDPRNHLPCLSPACQISSSQTSQ